MAQRVFSVEVTYGRQVCKQAICVTLVTGRSKCLQKLFTRNKEAFMLLQDIGENRAKYYV